MFFFIILAPGYYFVRTAMNEAVLSGTLVAPLVAVCFGVFIKAQMFI